MARRHTVKKLIAVALAGVVGVAAYAAYRCSRYISSELHPVRRSVSAEQRAQAAALGLEDLALTTSDGVRVAAWQRPARNGASIVLLHGVGQNRAELMPEADALAARGFGVVLLDFRAHGDTPGALCTWGDREREELRAAIDFLAARGDQVGVYGFSMGASVAATVAAKDARVRAVVMSGAIASLDRSTRDELRNYGPLGRWAAFATFDANGVRHEEVDALGSIPALGDRLRLLVIGSDDPFVPKETTDELAAAAGPGKVLVVHGAGHGGYAASPSGPEYLRAIVEAFASLG